MSLSTVMPERDWERSAYYNEIVRPMNGFYGLMAGRMQYPSDPFTLVGVPAPERAGFRRRHDRDAADAAAACRDRRGASPSPARLGAERRRISPGCWTGSMPASSSPTRRRVPSSRMRGRGASPAKPTGSSCVTTGSPGQRPRRPRRCAKRSPLARMRRPNASESGSSGPRTGRRCCCRCCRCRDWA